jgi:hypothetical protein
VRGQAAGVEKGQALGRHQPGVDDLHAQAPDAREVERAAVAAVLGVQEHEVEQPLPGMGLAGTILQVAQECGDRVRDAQAQHLRVAASWDEDLGAIAAATASPTPLGRDRHQARLEAAQWGRDEHGRGNELAHLERFQP